MNGLPPAVISAKGPSVFDRTIPLLVLAVAVAMVSAQIIYTRNPDVQFGIFPEDQYYKLSLPEIARRVHALEQITNALDREKYSSPMQRTAQRLDRSVPPDARIFVTGVLGHTPEANRMMYVHLRSALFPRDVEISLGEKIVVRGGELTGIPCESPAVLRDQGFDLLVRIEAGESIVAQPLTVKGFNR